MMRKVIERARGYNDLFWVVAVALSALVIGWFVVEHLRTNVKLYETAHARAHQAWRGRNLTMQGEYLDLEQTYRSQQLDWSSLPYAQSHHPVSDEQSVVLEAE